jgi:hypothetical protein
LLDYSDILALRPLSVDGVLEIISNADDVLKAAMVIVDTESDDDQISGVVLAVGTTGFTLAPDAAACGFSGDIVVEYAADAQLTTVTITADSSEIMQGGTPSAGQTVGLGGECTASGYTANTIVIIDDQRP